MKKKIVLQVHMPCPKCPRKAFAVAAAADSCGVESLAIEGQQKNQVVVIGNGIDIVKLAERLRKRVGCTDVVSVSDVN